MAYSNMPPRLRLLGTWREFSDRPQDLFFLPGGRLLNLDLGVVAEEDLDSEEGLPLPVDVDLEAGGELSQERAGDFARLKRDRA